MVAASYQLCRALALGALGRRAEHPHPRPPRGVSDRQRHGHQHARRHAPRARARRQRLGTVVDARRVRPAAPARDLGRDAHRPRRRDDAKARSRSRTATTQRHPATSSIGTQKTKQLLPWAFMAGANVDVTPHLEVGARGALLAVSPVQEAAHRRHRHLPRARARDDQELQRLVAGLGRRARARSRGGAAASS